jgi:hypothetical protein
VFVRDYSKSNVAWPTAVVLVIVIIALSAASVYADGHTLSSHQLSMVALKIVGYVGLGFWARNWSRIGALLLLIWHVYLFGPFAFHSAFPTKVLFWLPGVLFLFGCISALGREALLKKVQRKDLLQKENSEAQQAVASNRSRPPSLKSKFTVRGSED